MAPVPVTNTLTINDNEMKLSVYLITRASAKPEHQTAGYMAKLVFSMDVSQEAEEKDESICDPSIPL